MKLKIKDKNKDECIIINLFFKFNNLVLTLKSKYFREGHHRIFSFIHVNL